MSVSRSVPVLVTVSAWGAEAAPRRTSPKASAAGLKLACGKMPVPESATTRGPSSVGSVQVASRGPTASGAKVIVQVVDSPVPSVTGAGAGAMANEAAPGPVSCAGETVSAALPVLVSVTGRDAEIVPSRCGPKARDACETWAEGKTPVPLRATEGARSPAKASVAARAPVAVGWNTTVHDALASGKSGRVPAACASTKSAASPLRVGPVSESRSVPVLVSVMVWASAPVPLRCAPKSSAAAESEATGKTPVPESESVRSPASVCSVTVAVRAPVPVGAKRTEPVMEVPAAMIAAALGGSMVKSEGAWPLRS